MLKTSLLPFLFIPLIFGQSTTPPPFYHHAQNELDYYDYYIDNYDAFIFKQYEDNNYEDDDSYYDTDPFTRMYFEAETPDDIWRELQRRGYVSKDRTISCDWPHVCSGDSECIQSFKQNGSAEVSCKCRNGTFGMRCQYDENKCQQRSCGNGQCKLLHPPNRNNSLADTTYCVCDHGYTGEECDLRINFCDDEFICKNNGTCFEVEPDFQCNCTDGFTGKDCSEKTSCIHSSRECKNGGACMEPRTNEFVCECKGDWVGPTCETLGDNRCGTNLCLNGGVCVSLSTEARSMSPRQPDEFSIESFNVVCKCKFGFSGVFCEKDNSACRWQPCAARETCVTTGDGEDDFECKCELCEGVHCTFNRCMNGGRCLLLNYKPVCHCQRGFQGDRCQERENICDRLKQDEMPINSVCIDTTERHIFKCAEGYVWDNTSFQCLPSHSTCKSEKLCKNLGVCHPNPENGTVCICLSDYNGKHDHFGRYCEKTKSTCRADVCNNVGSCLYLATADNTEHGVHYTVDDTKHGFHRQKASGDAFCKCDHDKKFGRECLPYDADFCYMDGICANNGTCVPKSKSKEHPHCQCADGYTGKYCEIKVDFCKFEHLHNTCYHGRCRSLNDKSYCVCEPGWIGEYCDFDVRQQVKRIETCGSSDFMCICDNDLIRERNGVGLNGFQCTALHRFPGTCERDVNLQRPTDPADTPSNLRFRCNPNPVCKKDQAGSTGLCPKIVFTLLPNANEKTFHVCADFERAIKAAFHMEFNFHENLKSYIVGKFFHPKTMTLHCRNNAAKTLEMTMVHVGTDVGDLWSIPHSYVLGFIRKVLKEYKPLIYYLSSSFEVAVPHSGEGGEYYYLKGTKPSKTSDISKSSTEKNLEDQNEKDLKTTTAATTTSPVSPPFRTEDKTTTAEQRDLTEDASNVTTTRENIEAEPSEMNYGRGIAIFLAIAVFLLMCVFVAKTRIHRHLCELILAPLNNNLYSYRRTSRGGDTVNILEQGEDDFDQHQRAFTTS